MKYRYILFGAPGGNKAQGQRSSIPRFYHCPCGDVFRSIDTRTKVGEAFLEYSSRGQLVDDITVELWKEAIDAAVDSLNSSPISTFWCWMEYAKWVRPKSWTN
jgi:adenylate kinase